MGGGPCRLKQIVDSGAAAQHAFECMRNTGLIVLPLGYGPSKEATDAYTEAVQAYADACSKVAEELTPHLPTEP